ncbi:hypothetical protein CW749_05275 [Vibrio sp. vnigr-6D03]|nr:hypothetical protein CW749_05275 [Vibrio sp. vnigr-6D03]
MLGFHAALPILDLEPLDLQIGALPENQAILAEPSTLRWFEYRSKWGVTTKITNMRKHHQNIKCKRRHTV